MEKNRWHQYLCAEMWSTGLHSEEALDAIHGTLHP